MTAVEWLIEQILVRQELYFDNDGDFIEIPRTTFTNAYMDHVDLSDFVNKAKQMEKEEIRKAMNFALDEDGHTGDWKIKFIEKYIDNL